MENTLVRHIVIFKYREGTPDGLIQQVSEAFRALPGLIPGILSFEYGVNNSLEGRNFGFSHVFTLTFANAQARDAYLPHPQHRAFGALLQRLDVVEDIFVIDYIPTPSAGA